MIGAESFMVEVEHDSALREEELIRRVVGGARDEFRHLMRAHQDKIFCLILRQVGDEDLARELAQEVFFKAYRSLSKFRFESSFSTWLVRIALNHTNSYFSSKRFKQQQKTVSLDMAAYKEIPGAEQETAYDRESVLRLRRAIQRLKPNFRDVLVLCALERKTYEEVASILGIAVGTVRSRLNRARNQLQEIYYEV